MNCEAVIFDCDGTLVDTEQIGNEVLVEYLATLGVVLSVEEACSRFAGIEMKHSLALVESLLERPLPSNFLGTLRDLTFQAFAQRLRPTEGVHSLVQSLRVPYCIASNAPRAKIELCLSVTGLLPLFANDIHTAYEVGVWKPDPTLFLHAASAMGAAPSQCVVVEDSMAGINAGISAGMTVYAYQPRGVDPRIPKDVQIFTRFEMLRDELRSLGAIV